MQGLIADGPDDYSVQTVAHIHEGNRANPVCRMVDYIDEIIRQLPGISLRASQHCDI